MSDPDLANKGRNDAASNARLQNEANKRREREGRNNANKANKTNKANKDKEGATSVQQPEDGTNDRSQTLN